MRRLAFVALLALAGCATGPQPPPPGPTLADIDATWTQLETTAVPPEAILAIGSALDDVSCYGWLDQQILGSQQSSALQGILGAGGGMAAIAGGPAGMGAAAGAGLLSSILGVAQANSPIGNDPVAAYGLVLKMRQTWQAGAGIPMTREAAWAFVQSYHELCSLSGIRLAMHMAALTAPVSTASSGTGFAASAMSGRQRPPVVIVGAPLAQR